jgi:hypothetical protein
VAVVVACDDCPGACAAAGQIHDMGGSWDTVAVAWYTAEPGRPATVTRAQAAGAQVLAMPVDGCNVIAFVQRAQASSVKAQAALMASRASGVPPQDDGHPSATPSGVCLSDMTALSGTGQSSTVTPCDTMASPSVASFSLSASATTATTGTARQQH